MQQIFNKLKELSLNSYSPYSNYKVSAIVETEKGFFNGVNVECGAYPLTICAEKSAIVNAISNGSKEFKTIYLLTSSKDTLGMPCGGCRQVILEHFKPEQTIVVFDLNGNHKSFKISEILPYAWTSDTLKSK